jgi:hypothetical protein
MIICLVTIKIGVAFTYLMFKCLQNSCKSLLIAYNKLQNEVFLLVIPKFQQTHIKKIYLGIHCLQPSLAKCFCGWSYFNNITP